MKISFPTDTTLIVQVTKHQVDIFEPGKRVPSCQLRLDWNGNEQPTALCHHVTINGAKEPFNFIAIESGIKLPQQLSHSVGMETDQGLHVEVSHYFST